MNQLEDFTKRERDIALLLGKNLTNREIADQLYISVSTVKWYARSIYQKLGLHDVDAKRQAVRRYVCQHWQHDRAVLSIHFPDDPTSFVGREAEQRTLASYLNNAEIRLVTVLAPGGMGKTRLALQTARQVLTAFDDGVCFVSLHSEGEGVDVLAAISRAVQLAMPGIDLHDDRDLFAYLAHLNLLLILDNCEYIDNPLPLYDLLRATSKLKIIATTRERLGLAIEFVYVLKGLRYPHHHQEGPLESYPAVQLLVSAIRRVRPDFALTTNDRDSVKQIVQMTEGMPLALVLAASWADVMSLDAIVAQMRQSADVLETTLADIPPRQRSIRVIFQTVWACLSPDERTAYMRLSVFQGGFDSNAARAVTDVSPVVLRTLIHKSLVVQDENRRFVIHELLRQYAEQELNQSSESASIYMQHATYFANYASQYQTPLFGRRARAAFEALDAEADNIYVAWNHAIAFNHVDVIHALLSILPYYIGYDLSSQRRMCGQARRVLESGLVRDDHPVWADVLMWQNWNILKYQTQLPPEQLEVIRSELLRAQAIALRHRKVNTYVQVEMLLGYVAGAAYEVDKAIAHVSTALELAHEHDFPAVAAHLYLDRSAMSLIDHGADPEPDLHAALQLFEQLDDTGGWQRIRTLWSVYHMMAGNYRDAYTSFADVIRVAEQRQFPVPRLVSRNMARLHFLHGEFAEARVWAEQADAITEQRQDSMLSGGGLVWAVLHCIEARYEEALNLLQELYRIVNVRDEASYVAWGLSMACIGIGDFDRARGMCELALRFAYERNLQGAIAWNLPLAAVLLKHEGRLEHAVSVIELARHHPNSSSGWIDGWPLLNRMRDDLRETLGDMVYEQAKYRGINDDMIALSGTVLDYVST